MAIMKTIGLIGGTSWQSTTEYYRIINQEVNKRLGGYNSALIILDSINMQQVHDYAAAEDWGGMGDYLAIAARRLEGAGAGMVLICTNTLHKKADYVQSQIKIPLIHIADATAEKILAMGLRTVGLLGTRRTMQEDFYIARLAKRHGITAIAPDPDDITIINRIIFKELVKGDFREESRNEYRRVINNLASKGAEGIILGCTEIPLLIKQSDTNVPVFDTTAIHAMAAVELAMRE